MRTIANVGSDISPRRRGFGAKRIGEGNDTGETAIEYLTNQESWDSALSACVVRAARTRRSMHPYRLLDRRQTGTTDHRSTLKGVACRTRVRRAHRKQQTYAGKSVKSMNTHIAP